MELKNSWDFLVNNPISNLEREFKKFNKNYISAFNRDDIANILGIILSSVDYIYKLKTDTIKDDDLRKVNDDIYNVINVLYKFNRSTDFNQVEFGKMMANNAYFDYVSGGLLKAYFPEIISYDAVREFIMFLLDVRKEIINIMEERERERERERKKKEEEERKRLEELQKNVIDLSKHKEGTIVTCGSDLDKYCFCIVKDYEDPSKAVIEVHKRTSDGMSYFDEKSFVLAIPLIRILDNVTRATNGQYAVVFNKDLQVQKGPTCLNKEEKERAYKVYNEIIENEHKIQGFETIK